MGINYYAPPKPYVPPKSPNPELEPGQTGVTQDQMNNWNLAKTTADTAKTTAVSAYQKATAALPASGGTLTGQISASDEVPLRFDRPNYRTWVVHHSGNGNMYISPTATNGGSDYQFSQGICITPDNIVWQGGDMNTIRNTVNDLKSSVANGKYMLASALSDMGQGSSPSEDFLVLANRIRSLGARTVNNDLNVRNLDLKTSNTTVTYTLPGVNFTPQYLRIATACTYFYNGGQASANLSVSPNGTIDNFNAGVAQHISFTMRITGNQVSITTSWTGTATVLVRLSFTSFTAIG